MLTDPCVQKGSEESDEVVMLRLAKGEDSALNVLMQRWEQRVASFLYRMTGSHHTALELAHETFVKLYTARNRYVVRGKFSTWLFAIATNLARNHMRWQMRHPAISLEESEDAADRIVASESTPEEAQISTELLQNIQAAFQALPEKLREVMTLFIYEEMSYTEIATIVGCGKKAVETRIYRARQILKETLQELTV